MTDPARTGPVYLATPYSHPNRAVMEERFDQACRVAARYMASGEIVYSPIAHTHPIACRCTLPRGWDYWRRYAEAMLRACSVLRVVMMDGWRESRGIAGEIEIARELGIPVEFVEAR